MNPERANRRIAYDHVHCIYIQFCVNLFNAQGSTESTWYAWDFGDNTIIFNKTGLTNAEHVSHTYQKHGDFVVRLIAANKAGQVVITAEIIVKGLLFLLRFKTRAAVG